MTGCSYRTGWLVRPPYSSCLLFSAPTYSIPKYLRELTNKYGNVPTGHEIHDHSGGNKENEKVFGDSLCIIAGIRSKGGRPSSDHGADDGNSEVGPDDPIADTRLHGPH